MEYTQLIERILAAERSAQSISGEVARREAHMEEELEQETARLRAATAAHTQERVRAISREAAAAQQTAIQAQERRKAAVLERMERAYARYGDNWVQTLFLRIVGGQP